MFLALRLQESDPGYEVYLETRGEERLLGSLEPSEDPRFPWLTSVGQLEVSPEVAALRLAAHVLEDERLSLAERLA